MLIAIAKPTYPIKASGLEFFPNVAAIDDIFVFSHMYLVTSE
jgi:hypothetical protein